VSRSDQSSVLVAKTGNATALLLAELLAHRCWLRILAHGARVDIGQAQRDDQRREERDRRGGDDREDRTERGRAEDAGDGRPEDEPEIRGNGHLAVARGALVFPRDVGEIGVRD